MAKTFPASLACLGAVCAGVALAALLARGPSPAAASPANAAAATHHSEMRTSQETTDRLRQLARDPFITLSDEEIARLAADLDPSHGDAVHLLEGVLNPALHDRLWEACLRAHAKELSYDQLHRLAASIPSLTRPSGEILSGVFDRIRDEGSRMSSSLPM